MNKEQFNKISRLVKLKNDIEYQIDGFDYNGYMPYMYSDSSEEPTKEPDISLFKCHKENVEEMAMKVTKILQDHLNEILEELKELGYED